MNSPIENVEMTLLQWAGSKWSFIFARIGMVVLATSVSVGGGFITWAVLSTKGDVATVALVQDSRAVDGENFQTEVRGNVSLLRSDLTSLQDQVFKVSVDVGVIKRLLTEIRRDVATAAPVDRPRVLEPLAAALSPLQFQAPELR